MMAAEALASSVLRRWLPALAIAGATSAVIWLASGGLAVEARVTLIAFALAIASWTLLPLDDLLVAGLAVAALLLAGATDVREIAALAHHDLIWLLIASYVIAAALRKTTLMERLAIAVAQGSASLEGLFYRLTAVVAATAFVVPTTSGRAALLLPVFLGFSDVLRHAQATKALSLMFPSVILLSACGALTGAGAHLIALEFMAAGSEAARIGYLEWSILALPIALLSSYAATFATVRMFLSPEDRRRPPVAPQGPGGAMTNREIEMLAVLAAAILLWATDGLHRFGLATVGLVAALALVILAGGMTVRAVVGAVEWKLLLFLGATMLLGDALMSTGAGSWIARSLLAEAPAGLLATPWMVAALVAALALVSHAFILSRSARAAVLVPVVAIPLADHAHSTAAIALLIVVGTGFCQSTRVSAKPLMIFGGVDRPVFSSADLMRLSAWLLPLVWALLVLFACVVWPALGLEFTTMPPAFEGNESRG
jgi:sodium-dependent dicarboxylate transporter 2/3/5